MQRRLYLGKCGPHLASFIVGPLRVVSEMECAECQELVTICTASRECINIVNGRDALSYNQIFVCILHFLNDEGVLFF
jgi:hypothetical protein